jgi:hypothetical protein
LYQKDLAFLFPTPKFEAQLYPFYLDILETCGIIYTLNSEVAIANLLEVGSRKKENIQVGGVLVS